MTKSKSKWSRKRGRFCGLESISWDAPPIQGPIDNEDESFSPPLDIGPVSQEFPAQNGGRRSGNLGANQSVFDDLSDSSLSSNGVDTELMDTVFQDGVGQLQTNNSMAHFAVPDLNFIEQTQDVGEGTDPPEVMAITDMDEPFPVVSSPVGNAQNETHGMSSEDIFLANLYWLCTNTPGMQLYMFDRILKTIKHGASMGCNFTKLGRSSKKTFLGYVREQFPAPKPIPVTIDIETDNHDTLLPNRKGRERATLIKYDVKQLILDKLGQTETFGDINNLVVNPLNRWGRFQAPPGRMDELRDGTVHQYMYEQKGLREGFDLLSEVQLYMDDTGVTGNQRYGLTPVILTFGILKREVRFLTKNVCVLGFIPDYDRKSSAQKASIRGRVKGRGRSCRTMHRLLGAIFRDLLKAQNELATEFTWVRLGDEIRKVRLHMPVTCSIGDGKQQDLNATRYASHKNAKRICRFCRTSYEDADNPNVDCIQISISEIKTLIHESRKMPAEGLTREVQQQVKQGVQTAQLKLKEICSHNSLNAFWYIDIGGQQNLPLPHDGMHIMSGIIQKLLKLVYSPLSAGEKARVDDLVVEIFAKPKSSERRNFPRTDFSRGMTNLTMLTADEWTGTLLTTLLLSMTMKGRDAINEAFTRERARANKERTRIVCDEEIVCGPSLEGTCINEMIFIEELEELFDSDGEGEPRPVSGSSTKSKKKVPNKKKTSRRLDEDEELPPLNEIDHGDFVECLEEILIFQSWYCLGYPGKWDAENPPVGTQFYWDNNSEGKLRDKIRELMTKILVCFPRRKGNGWKIQKFHELLHLATDTQRYGLPANFDAGWGERELKTSAKNPARSSQKRNHQDFLWQVNTRLYDINCGEHMRRVIHNTYGESGFALSNYKMDGCNSESEADISSHGEKETNCTIPSTKWKNAIHSNGLLSWGKSNPHWKMKCNDGLYGDCAWQTRAGKKHGTILHEAVELAIQEHNHGQTSFKIDGYTEFFHSGQRLRAHPNYRGGREWYDWVMLEFEDDCLDQSKNLDDPSKPLPKGRFPFNTFPSKILGIFQTNAEEDDELMLVVHPCTYSNHLEDTRLVEIWDLEYKTVRREVPDISETGNVIEGSRLMYMKIPNLLVVPATSIRAGIYVVEEMPGFRGYIRPDINPEQSTRVLYVRSRRLYWPHHFDF